MLILFEGLDKVGKTTLIKNFRDLSNMPVFKNPVKPDAYSVFRRGYINGLYFGAYLSASLSGVDMIFDRSHITEIAYCKAKRNYEPEEETWLEWEEQHKHHVVVVYVTAPLETIKQRFIDDKEEYLKDEDIDAINTKYNEYMMKSKLSLITIDGSMDRQRMLSHLIIGLQNLFLWSPIRNR